MLVQTLGRMVLFYVVYKTFLGAARPRVGTHERSGSRADECPLSVAPSKAPAPAQDGLAAAAAGGAPMLTSRFSGICRNIFANEQPLVRACPACACLSVSAYARPVPRGRDTLALSPSRTHATLAWHGTGAPGGHRQELFVYVSEHPTFAEFERPGALVWSERGLRYGDWDGTRTASVSLPLSPAVQHNGTLYLHAYMVKRGYSPDVLADRYRSDAVVEAHVPVIKYWPRRKEKTRRRLLGDDGTAPMPGREDGPAEEGGAGEVVVAYLHPNVSLALVTDQLVFQHGKYPDPTVARTCFVGTESATHRIVWSDEHRRACKGIGVTHIVPVAGAGCLRRRGGKGVGAAEIALDEATGGYRPLFYRNEFWLLREHYMLINDTVTCVHPQAQGPSVCPFVYVYVPVYVCVCLSSWWPDVEMAGPRRGNREVVLHMDYAPISLTRWQVYSQLDKSLAMQQQFGLSDGESDEFRVRAHMHTHTHAHTHT
jgi:hypothetical protein